MKKILLSFLGLVVVGGLLFILLWPSRHKDNLRSMKEVRNSYPEVPVPLEGKIILIYAHSDDELATIAQVARLKRENPELSISWYLVSDGGRGLIWPGTCSDLSKQECRLKEAKKVAKCAGIEDPVSLNLPDGKVGEQENLESFLLDKIPELKSSDIAYIFTHDNRGLYGHPDHVSVYDAVKNISKKNKIPLITLALPDYFKEKIRLMGKAKTRHPRPITHALVLNEKDIDVKVCASNAHASQKLILNLLMFQGLKAREFFEASPREFLNLVGYDKH